MTRRDGKGYEPATTTPVEELPMPTNPGPADSPHFDVDESLRRMRQQEAEQNHTLDPRASHTCEVEAFGEHEPCVACDRQPRCPECLHPWSTHAPLNKAGIHRCLASDGRINLFGNTINVCRCLRSASPLSLEAEKRHLSPMSWPRADELRRQVEELTATVEELNGPPHAGGPAVTTPGNDAAIGLAREILDLGDHRCDARSGVNMDWDEAYGRLLSLATDVLWILAPEEVPDLPVDHVGDLARILRRERPARPTDVV